MKRKIAMLALLTASAAPAQNLELRTQPDIGTRHTTAVGSKVWEQYQFEGVPGVVIDTAVQARWGSLEFVDLPARSLLATLREKRLKACRVLQQFNNLYLRPIIWRDCLIDKDDNGTFDEISYTSGGFAKKIDPPLPYRRTTIEMTGDGPKTFRKILLFVGSDSSSIKFSYREFSNDMARPAFTEELSLPLGASFPQNIAIKDRIITIHGIDGMGLSYELVK
jgi:hypothetical protein